MSDALLSRWQRIREMMGALKLSQADLGREWRPGESRATINWILNEERILRETADLEAWLQKRYDKIKEK